MTPASLRAAALVLLGAVWQPAQAQLGLPRLPSLPTLPAPVAPALQRPLPAVTELIRARQERVADMLQQRRQLVEPDPAGEPAVRGQVLVTSPAPALIDAARAEGFTVMRERRLEALDLTLVTLRAPEGWDTARAVRRLRELDPQAAIDFNHLYLESGTVDPLHAASPPGAAPSPSNGRFKVGLIDAGVETDHPLLRGAAVRAWGCGSRKVPSAHGTAVASLLVGRAERFRSAAPDAVLYAADVYCDDPIGGSIEAVAAALAWLIGEQVAVVNISLVGPANRTLEQVVRRATSRGILLVAAVGNDGPAAAPLYPAAYPEVVAVTAVDARGDVLPEACRGPHVAFAAPGADMVAAGFARAPYAVMRGTSFAAPLVAGLLAARLHQPDVTAAGLALTALARQAIDAGAPGRDVVYGHGVVGRELRTEPALVLR
ncbi:S8 family serine peptidase [Piscinibacter sp. XHJ-5]|uniref:S8 family serine peptidase n=1 Tax=Piscinibacter sp. XHJ-5 TaxID=3037797 RepID=UPI0024532ADC|nr:S8 family serine peptidase [Piscinibacter sp. XHJ-5]